MQSTVNETMGHHLSARACGRKKKRTSRSTPSARWKSCWPWSTALVPQVGSNSATVDKKVEEQTGDSSNEEIANDNDPTKMRQLR